MRLRYTSVCRYFGLVWVRAHGQRTGSLSWERSGVVWGVIVLQDV